MFKNVDKSMLMKLVALHVVVITVSNALVAIPVEIFGVKTYVGGIHISISCHSNRLDCETIG